MNKNIEGYKQSAQQTYSDMFSQLSEFQKTKSEKSTIKELEESLGVGEGYFYDYARRGLKKALIMGAISSDEYNNFITLYSSLRSPRGKASSFVSQNPIIKQTAKQDPYGKTLRSDTEFIMLDGQNSVPKIVNYAYGVYNRHGEFIEGLISPETMNNIYNLYSKEAVNVTQRDTYRDIFPELDVDFDTFQRIIRVFNITKASIPHSVDVMEEASVEELLEKTFQVKENKFFKRLESEKIRQTEALNIKLMRENQELKNKWGDIEQLVKTLDFSNIVPVPNINKDILTERALVVYLSDIHVGCLVTPDALFENNYDEQEIINRFDSIIQSIYAQYILFGHFDKIIICNLGDSLDGMNGQTTRGGHTLPQNMDNRQQITTFINVMKHFMDSLHQMNIANSIDFYCVGDSNHGGDCDWLANKLLEQYLTLKYPNSNAKVFNRFIDYFIYGVHTIILTHGKDSSDMKFGFPLYLDEKTENKINNILDYNSLYGKSISFIKGDLHTPSTCYGRRFRYRNVGSIMGASKWIMNNFSQTKPLCSMDIYDKKCATGIYETSVVLHL